MTLNSTIKRRHNFLVITVGTQGTGLILTLTNIVNKDLNFPSQGRSCENMLSKVLHIYIFTVNQRWALGEFINCTQIYSGIHYELD